MCKKKDDIRFNYKSNHLGVIKRKRGKRKTAVFMSTQEFNNGKQNIPMERNADPEDSSPSYFMKRVRTYTEAYGPRQKQMSLTDNDRKIADSIYRNYLKNVAEQKKRQKQKLKKKKTKK